MNTYKFVLSVEVEVEAYDEHDAEDIVNDTFGPGEDCGVEVTKLEIRQK